MQDKNKSKVYKSLKEILKEFKNVNKKCLKLNNKKINYKLTNKSLKKVFNMLILIFLCLRFLINQ